MPQRARTPSARRRARSTGAAGRCTPPPGPAGRRQDTVPLDEPNEVGLRRLATAARARPGRIMTVVCLPRARAYHDVPPDDEAPPTSTRSAAGSAFGLDLRLGCRPGGPRLDREHHRRGHGGDLLVHAAVGRESGSEAFGQRLPSERMAAPARVLLVVVAAEGGLGLGPRELGLGLYIDLPPVSRAARRALSPSLPMASASWSPGTTTVAPLVSSSTNTSRTRAGESALATNRARSVFHG